jgi:hypothetical protein
LSSGLSSGVVMWGCHLGLSFWVVILVCHLGVVIWGLPSWVVVWGCHLGFSSVGCHLDWHLDFWHIPDLGTLRLCLALRVDKINFYEILAKFFDTLAKCHEISLFNIWRKFLIAKISIQPSYAGHTGISPYRLSTENSLKYPKFILNDIKRNC